MIVMLTKKDVRKLLDLNNASWERRLNEQELEEYSMLLARLEDTNDTYTYISTDVYNSVMNIIKGRLKVKGPITTSEVFTYYRRYKGRKPQSSVSYVFRDAIKKMINQGTAKRISKQKYEIL